MRFLTLATVDLLPQARVLARSLERQRPGSSLEVLLTDSGAPVARAIEAGESFRLRSAAQELDLDIERLIALHDQQELTALLVPRLLRTYATREPGPLLHVPPSVWFLGGLEPIEAALAARSVLLTPRMSGDVPEDGLEPTSLRVERQGRIDEAIVGVDGSAEADDFLEWWGARVEAIIGSLDGGQGARPEDRPWLARYLELAPARFATAVLDEPGFNLSMWNLHEHTLQSTPDGAVVDGRWPLRFLNLPGFEPDRPHRLSALAGRVRVSRSPVLRDLCIRYAQELREAGSCDPSLRGEVGRRLADGLVYDERLCALHARARALGERFDELFAETGTQAFMRWLQGPAPTGAAHGINRYVFYTVAGERPDVLRAYPDLDADDGARYVSWCWDFGRRELTIPDRFMPPGPNGRAVHAPPSGEERGVARALTPARPAAPVADADVAVRVSGYLGHTLGLGAAARGYVRALGAAAVPVTTVSVPLHHLERPQALADDYGHHGYEDLIHDGSHGFELIAVNADELPGFVARLGEDYFEGPRIGIWGWETNTIPPRWQQAFALVDEIWVYSRFMAENIGAVAPVPVIALPPPVQRPQSPAEPQRLGVPDGFLFLFVFDYLSTVQRKNPVGLVEAFARAFAPEEGPQLLIKTINAPLRPLADEEVLWAAHGRPDVHLIDRSLSAEELDGLMAACDCYVSLHRAEGFGLTMAEAMAIGKPVIATGYSGNVDFMNAENSYPVDYTIGLVGPESEIYPADGEWAHPSVEHAAELMRRVVAEPEEAARIGARAAQDIATVLSPASTGAAMRRRLEELTARGVRIAQAPARG
jgi:glycosyltransferase involved in cell wall biosynthesis